MAIIWIWSTSNVPRNPAALGSGLTDLSGNFGISFAGNVATDRAIEVRNLSIGVDVLLPCTTGQNADHVPIVRRRGSCKFFNTIGRLQSVLHKTPTWHPTRYPEDVRAGDYGWQTIVPNAPTSAHAEKNDSSSQ